MSKSPYTDGEGNEITPVSHLRVAVDTEKKRSAEVVRMLEQALEQARSGEITDLCYIAVRNGEYEIARTVSIMDAIAQSAFLHYRFLRQMERP
jgi:hypothetical protein